MKQHSLQCPSCHKKSAPGRACSKCGIVFERWLDAQVMRRNANPPSSSFLSRRYWFVLGFGLALTVTAFKVVDILRERAATLESAAPLSPEELDTPEKVLAEMARLANDKTANIGALKQRLKELSPLVEATPFVSSGGDQVWENGASSRHKPPKNLVKGRDRNGTRYFEIDNRVKK